MEWQAISTAPKDGTPIIIAYRLADGVADFEVSSGFYWDGYWRAAWPHTDPPSWSYGQPEMWQPMPEPPKKAAQGRIINRQREDSV